MIPVPTYLRKFAKIEKTGKDTITISLCCPCGCKQFLLYENYLTKEEKCELKPYQDALEDLMTRKNGSYGSTYIIDEDGIGHYWKYLTPLLRKGPKVEVHIPPKPFFSGIQVLKMACVECKEEYVLFDNRYHGYDGKTGEETDNQAFSYVPNFRQKLKQPAAFEVKIENDSSLEEFNQNAGLNYDMEDYSDAFSWFSLYAIDPSNKKRKIFDYETA